VLAKVQSCAVIGLDALPIQVEVDIATGLERVTLVGLPDTAVRESSERVRAAITNSGYYFPSHRLTINLAPADLRKEGPAYDLPIAVGILAATHQYSIFDYVATFIGFLGISVPGFLIALFILYTVFASTGVALTGLFSPQFVGAPWSLAKVVDLAKHVWLPMVVIGISGTAGLIRVTRGMMLDELGKQYVITARAKGVPEGKLLFKYPVRLAVNPLISTIGWLLPGIISGEALVSIVLNLPTMGPLLLRAVMVQDMPLAGSFLLMTSVLTVIGTLLSDILLAILDPRIRFGAVTEES